MKLQKLTMTSLCLAGILSFQHLRAQETEPEINQTRFGKRISNSCGTRWPGCDLLHQL